MGLECIPAASDPAQIEFYGPRHFKFSTLYRANSRRTTSFMAGSIGARNAGRNDR